MTACALCFEELVEIGPDGGSCRRGHWTAREAFSLNGKHDVTPTPNGHGPTNPTNLLTIVSASDLIAKVFPEPRWAVEGVVPEGLSLLAGPPKMGKSFLLLGVGVAIAAGGYALGKVQVGAGDVLYLALEDTERRLQERLVRILDGATAPSRLHLATSWPRIEEGGLAAIDAWLSHHPETRFVAIDTLAKFRSATRPGGSLYADDYAAIGSIKELADRRGVAFVVATHVRKADAEDPLDTVSGTAGQAGAADTTLILQREIGRADACLYVRGRDVPEGEHALSFDAVTCTWNLLGDAAEYRLSEGRAEVVKLLRATDEALTPKQIAESLGGNRGNIRVLLHRMANDGQVVGSNGRYRLPPVTGVTAVTDAEHPVSPVTGVTGVQSVYACVGCGLPRSRDTLPCPECGAVDGQEMKRGGQAA